MTRARDLNPVRLRREQQGMLLIELAAKVGRSPGFVSQVEGGFVPKLPSMRSIAQALDTTPLDLWPEEIEEIGKVEEATGA